ncbi:hypothetical protein D0Z08_04330 [Nocardioides immobilis]|uniref:Uncharacterized protein n=1 Tax=Nocardioides immobilis TaxID=2049295 RepID=A0A417Y6L6_9ACTN|nr:hypothetical protein [Nocardioides immobilis]RHW28217.1 hypothetical protein D0Z08_04330 [Nocardioides immobilis]
MRASSGRDRFVESPPPRAVEGYDEAVRAGLTPQVPGATPPSVDVVPTARTALRQAFVVVGAAAVAIAVTMVVGGRGGGLGGPQLFALLAVSVLGITAVAVAVRRFGRVQLDELQHGYTTTSYKLGRWWMRVAPDGPVTVGWVEWDWSGTWVLRPDGVVVSAPRPDRDAPGLYPSPRRPGSLELWTGHQWSGYVPPRRWTARGTGEHHEYGDDPC